MGGFETLFVAADAGQSEPLTQFDRYIAINTPVRLLYGMSKLDEFYQAPWPGRRRNEPAISRMPS